MKKKLLLLATACFTAVSLQAQFELKLVGQTTVANGTTQIKNVSMNDEQHLDVDVKNLAAGTVNSLVSRKIIVAPVGNWLEQVCYGSGTGGGGCFDINFSPTNWSAGIPNDLVTILADGLGLMNIKVTPDANVGSTAHLRYYIGTSTNPFMDSIDFIVNSTVSVKDLKKDILLSVSPNPASDFVNIKVTNGEKGNYKITDVLGNVVAADSFTSSKTVDVSDFRNGVYFIVISGEGLKTINRKLVVKH